MWGNGTSNVHMYPGCKKRVKVVLKGDSATADGKTPDLNVCMVWLAVTKKLSWCESCRCGRYCSDKCKSEHKNHELYCGVICSLEKLEREKREKNEIFVSDAEKLPLKMKRSLIRLVGLKPLINIFLNDLGIVGLWDTGAMISLINENYLQATFPTVKIHPLADFTGNDSFSLTTANQSPLCVKGVAILSFGVEEGRKLFEVPFLVTSEEISDPIIGYNIIEYLVTNFKDKVDLPTSLTKVIGSLSVDSAKSMINLVEKGGEFQELHSEVKLKETYEIFPGCIKKVKCKIKDLKVNNPMNKIIMFSPFEELFDETELVIFESTEILKHHKKYIEILVYNPSAT